MIQQRIKLIYFGRFEKEFLENLADSLQQIFSFPVDIESAQLDLTQYYDPARKQYDGNNLLKMIESNHSQSNSKSVGLFRVDLFIPILTYIYGQAFLNGNSAIASLFRLKNERYGMPADETLLLDRFKKEVVHELGHTFGLKHCHVPGCVMVSSTYVEDIDQKNVEFCAKCRAELTSTAMEH